MRKELYQIICDRLSHLYETSEGAHICLKHGEPIPDGARRIVKHIDLWNHNVEFIEQEESWERPAVFVEFVPIRWVAIQPGAEYRAEAQINLHVVTDWSGSVSAGSEFREDGLRVFDLLETIHGVLAGADGDTFMELDLAGSQTNHNHEEIIENIEMYQCVAFRSI
ncbi:MAG: hypothetical protein PUG76_00665 [Prevotellaceae bacterium]|nr:hypothetical protein [Prevotellaceae bacterium]